MNIKEIIQILRTATLNSITKKSLSESCLVQFESICDAVEALKELDKPNIAASPQRTWVGLRDEEMKKTWYEMQNIMGWYSFQEIAQAIEAKLKDKNT